MTDEQPNLGVTETDEMRAALRHKGAKIAGDFAVSAARLMLDSHCEDIVVFDVRGISQLTDFIVIASGTSDRQIRSVGDHLEETAKEFELERFGGEVDKTTTWLVVDFVDVVVHLFEPVMRAHYDLEMMWGDAPKVEWRRDAS